MNRTGVPTTFESAPEMIEGPLSRLHEIQPRIFEEVVRSTHQELVTPQTSLDLMLGEALYDEKQRLKREHFNIFTRHRKVADEKLWSSVQAGLLQSPGMVDRSQLMDQILWHYSREIGGKFDPNVYRFATTVLPWGFNWLLNAASVKRILPWKWVEELSSRLRVVGEVENLQRLSQRGTILLVPTHQSNIDSVLIGYLIYLCQLPPFAYGAGLNLFSNPILSFFMSNLGAYTVDRKKRNNIYKTTLKNYSTQILREGVHSIFFPGGGRSRNGAIESKLKLGLLGTALDAQIHNLRENKSGPNVYIVPMVMSYHFVLEASSLIEEYLAESGKHRFINYRDESWQPTKIMNFFWKMFSAQSQITVRIGKPLDVFGNFVDEDGRSIGPNGSTVDPRKWLTTHGELKAVPERDREYTRELGSRLVERYQRENTVLSSHLVAFSYFEALKKQYRDLDLYRFLRLSRSQRMIPYETFMKSAEHYHSRLRDLSDKGLVYLSGRLQTLDQERWVSEGIKNLGMFHTNAVVKVGDGTIWSEDMNLLYYYRNRLSSYGLTN